VPEYSFDTSSNVTSTDEPAEQAPPVSRPIVRLAPADEAAAHEAARRVEYRGDLGDGLLAGGVEPHEQEPALVQHLGGSVEEHRPARPPVVDDGVEVGTVELAGDGQKGRADGVAELDRETEAAAAATAVDDRARGGPTEDVAQDLPVVPLVELDGDGTERAAEVERPDPGP
jgi:hypothetical protein